MIKKKKKIQTNNLKTIDFMNVEACSLRICKSNLGPTVKIPFS